MEDFFWKVADRYGVGVCFAVAAAVFFYFKIWPLLERAIVAHLDFVASSDETNKTQAATISKLADGQDVALKKLDQVHESQMQIAAVVRPPRDPPGWGVGNSRP